MAWASPGPDWAQPKKKPKKKKKAVKKEAAGPYRDQSSDPKIRKQAAEREHRKVKVRKKKDPTSLRGPLKLPTPTQKQVEQDDFPDLSSVLDRIKKAYEGNEVTGGNPAKDFIEEEAKTAVKAVKQNYDPERVGKPPTSEQVSTLANVAAGVSAGPAGKAAEKALSKAASAASDASWAKTAAKNIAKGAKAAPKKKAARIKSAPKRAAKRVKETPQRVRTAPKRAKKAASTPEGRRAAAKGTGRKAARHPFASFGGAGVLANQSGADIPGLKEAGAFVEGTGKAVWENPIGTGKTTARAIPSMVTGPAALIASGAESVASGSPDPLVTEAKKQGKGLVEIAKTLGSGDPDKVQKATEEEVGLAFTPLFPYAIKKTKGSKVYTKGVRGPIRKVREKPRAKKRARIYDEMRQAKFEGRAPSKRLQRKARKSHSVRDDVTGDFYVSKTVGRKINNRRDRVATSRYLSSVKATGDRAAYEAAKKIIKEIRKSKLARNKDHNVGDTLSTVAAYGISRDRKVAMKQLADLEQSITGGAFKPRDPDAMPAQINDLANVRWIRENADEFFTDKPFWNAVDEYKARAKEITTSGRKEVLAVGDVYGVRRPEGRMEDVGVDPYKQLETYERKRAELGEMKGELGRAEKLLAKDLTPEDRAKAQAAYDDIFSRTVKFDDEVSRLRRTKEAADAEYVAEVQGKIKETGGEQPAYVKDVVPRPEADVQPAYPAVKSAVRQHMADMEQSRRGLEVARDFETLINQSVAEPRLRRLYHDATSTFVATESKTVGGKRYITSEEFARAVERGELDPSQFSLMPAAKFKRAVLDPNTEPGAFRGLLEEMRPDPTKLEALRNRVKGEVASRANEPGNKYAVVRTEGLREFVHQFEPPRGMEDIFGTPNRILTRSMLGYSPSWAAAQLIAEGIPAGVSVVSANPAHWARVMKYMAKEHKRLDAKSRAVLDGTIGESAGVVTNPRIRLNPNTHLEGSYFFNRLATRNVLGRALLSGVKGDALGTFNRFTGGKYRKFVAVAKADREVNGFIKALSQTMRHQRRLSDLLKKKPLKEQMEWIARNPKELAKLEGYVDDMMGNFRAITRLEAKFAPLVIFYPFVRYSLRWTFWSLPKEHPVKAQILYFLGQLNSEELEKLTGGPVIDPVELTKPIYTNAEGDEEVLPAGTRFAPGMNSLVTAIGRQNIEQVIFATNPVVNLGYNIISGRNPFTGVQEAEGWDIARRGLIGLNALLSMPSPARMQIPGVDKSVKDLVMEGLGDEPSDVSRTFREMDPGRTERDYGNVLAGQDAESYRDQQRLSRALDESGWKPELGEDTLTQAVMAARKGDRSLVKQLIKRRESSEKAGDEISRLVRKYVSDPEQLEKFTDRDWKVVNEITGEMVIPYEREKKSGNPFLEAIEPSSEGNPYLEALKQKTGGNAYLNALK